MSHSDIYAMDYIKVKSGSVNKITKYCEPDVFSTIQILKTCVF